MKKVFVVLTLLLVGSFMVLGSHFAFAQDPAAAPAEKEVKIQPAPAAQPAAPAAEPAKPAAPAVAETPAAAPETPAAPAVLTPEKKTAIQQAAEKLIKEEISAVGSFEVDHPETGDLISLSLDAVRADVTESGEGEYLVKADFKDKGGATYVVAIYLDEISAGEFELADAIVESIDGKAVSGV